VPRNPEPLSISAGGAVFSEDRHSSVFL